MELAQDFPGAEEAVVDENPFPEDFEVLEDFTKLSDEDLTEFFNESSMLGSVTENHQNATQDAILSLPAPSALTGETAGTPRTDAGVYDVVNQALVAQETQETNSTEATKAARPRLRERLQETLSKCSVQLSQTTPTYERNRDGLNRDEISVHHLFSLHAAYTTPKWGEMIRAAVASTGLVAKATMDTLREYGAYGAASNGRSTKKLKDERVSVCELEYLPRIAIFLCNDDNKKYRPIIPHVRDTSQKSTSPKRKLEQHMEEATNPEAHTQLPPVAPPPVAPPPVAPLPVAPPPVAPAQEEIPIQLTFNRPAKLVELARSQGRDMIESASFQAEKIFTLDFNALLQSGFNFVPHLFYFKNHPRNGEIARCPIRNQAEWSGAKDWFKENTPRPATVFVQECTCHLLPPCPNNDPITYLEWSSSRVTHPGV